MSPQAFFYLLGHCLPPGGLGTQWKCCHLNPFLVPWPRGAWLPLGPELPPSEDLLCPQDPILFSGTLRMNLDCSKLRALGWKPETGLKEMFDRMIEDMKGNPAFRVREEP